MTHSCLNCEKDFQPARANNRYCSQSCRQQAYIKRNWTKAAPMAAPPANSGFAGISGLPGNIEPAKLLEVLSNLVQNPSMTDKVTDKSEKPVNTMVEHKNPSKSVNDGLTNHSKNAGFEAQNPYEEYLNEKKIGHITGNSDANSIFQVMLANELTISIPPNGYVRSLFPNWSDKEWKLSNYINEKMVKMFECFRTASNKEEITRTELIKHHELASEFSVGPLSECLPENYPFKQFLLLLRVRIGALLSNMGDQKRIRFRLPADLREMMMVLKIQIG